LSFAVEAALPAIVRSVAGGRGLSAELADVRLSLLRGELELRGLVVRTAAAGTPVAALEFVRLDLAPLALLRGSVVVRRVTVDGLTLELERTPDGRLPLLEQLAGPSAEAAPAEATAAPEPAPAAAPAAPSLPDLRWLRVE